MNIKYSNLAIVSAMAFFISILSIFHSFKNKKFILFFVCSFGFISVSFAQKLIYFPPVPKDTSKKKKIEIIKSDSLLYQTLELGKYRKLIGNVQLKHLDAFMFCDSAIIDIDANYMTAYGKQVHIKKGDSVDVWGNFLEYFGDLKQGRLTGMCSMRDKTMVLTAPELNYNTETDLGSYMSGGRVVNKETNITSAIGYYYHQTNTAVFYGDVVLKSPESTIYTDSLRYNTNKEIAYFITKTTIIDKDSNVIITHSGYYDTKEEKAFLGNNAIIKKGDAKVSAQSIDYNKKTKIAIAEGNVTYQDSSDRTTILSNYIYSDENNALVRAYKDPLMITVSEDEKDTMYLSADTLFSYRTLSTDSIKLNDDIENNDSIKIIKAWYRMKMIQGKMSAIADSLFYSEEDSIFKLYQHPVLWMDSTQISGDSIYLYNRDKEINRIDVFGKAFIIHLQDQDIYHQIKGKFIQAIIKDKKIQHIEVDGNAESIYFIKDKEGAYSGANKSMSAFITVSFNDGEVNRLKLTGAPEADFTPIKKITLSSFRLDGFNWQGNLQPLTKYDVIRDKQQYERYISGLRIKEK
ncbi:MAG: hypothetical protein RJA25_884 [Bacteroidota bacterium]|jgi:lipopolysaccharide export system protein LptA